MTDDWKKRWAVLIECRDCGATYECTGASSSVERMNGFNRMFVAGGPETCPECRNLKVATDRKEDDGERSNQTNQ